MYYDSRLIIILPTRLENNIGTSLFFCSTHQDLSQGYLGLQGAFRLREAANNRDIQGVLKWDKKGAG